MSVTSVQPQSWPSSEVLFTLLPGPNRKRTDFTYCYRLTYRNPDESAPGCAMTWEVSGGRLIYQIAVERSDRGDLHLHCTCADAVFRAEEEGRHCKHIQGLLAFGYPARDLAAVPAPVALRIWLPAAVPERASVRLAPREFPLGEVA